MSGVVLDLFAGPGGWDLGAREIGLDAVGIEIDGDALATRDAAGLSTHRGDVAAFDTADVPPLWGLIGSPPCPAYSSAGKGGGRRDMDRVEECLRAMGEGRDTRALYRDEITAGDGDALFGFATEDTGSLLVVEPLRFALAGRPEWIVLEQVPPVLPLWESMAEILNEHGWHTWTGILRADEYGVPQTRERAILMASTVGRPAPPPSTHQRWAKGAKPAPVAEAGRERWRTMAGAVGWNPGDRVGFPRRNDRAGDAGDAGEYRERDLRPASDPAFSLTEKARSWTRFGHDGKDHRVTTTEAAVLQGFPADHPWKGSPSSQFRQIGNAVPPPMAAAILRAVVTTRTEVPV